jgi:hypothetical protein
LILAAKYLGVSPIELERSSVEWLNWGLMMLSKDNEAEALAIEQARRASE